MLSVSPTTACFSGDQQFDITIEYYDTPYLVLEGSGNLAASAGVILDVREPRVGLSWTLAEDLENAASAGAAITIFDDPSLVHLIDAGRTGNVVNYWAGGAPGEHGATQVGRIGYHFTMYVRPPENRAWFSNAATVPTTFAFGGNGYFRIDVNSTNLVNRVVTEADFLATGLAISAAVSLVSGDRIDVYYVQRDDDSWGGFVFKPVFGDITALAEAERAAVVRQAPILGCGFADAGIAVPQRTVASWTEAAVSVDTNRPRTASVTLPLVNPSVTDLVGWEYEKDPLDPEDPGVVTWLNAGDVTGQFSMSRDRLVRIVTRINNESWPLFTGYISDVQPGGSSGQVQLSLSSAAQLLITTHDRNRPDRIDYMTYNFRRRRVGSDPVYDIPAFDNWPLEYAVRILLSRGGLDASLLDQPKTSPYYGISSVAMAGRILRKFEAMSMDSRRIRLGRPVHYGNYGQAYTELLPVDDEYLFPPVNTKDVYGRAQDLCDKYGYALEFDGAGHAVLQKVNAPTIAVDLDASDATLGTNRATPEAYGGTYVEVLNTGTVQKTIRAARVDLVVGRFVGAGTVSYSVARASNPGTPISTGSFNTTASRTEFFYDYEAATDGVNSTVGTVISDVLDTYIVTLTISGVCYIDCLLGYHVDFERSLVPATLTSERNAEDITLRGTGDESRNHVIIVGRRRATVTDSAKLRSTAENPESEFVVARAVDVRSITDPTALHYVGRVKETVIYSDQIADDDIAQYLARTFIYRYRNPHPGAEIKHTLLPFLDLRDPVVVKEPTYATLEDDRVQWVERISHTLRPEQWRTAIETTPFPPYPSFEPRTDIDIDRVFSGLPAVNVEIGYTSLSGHDILNMSGEAPLQMRDALWPSGERVEATLSVAGGVLDYDAAGLPMPLDSTVQIRPANVPDNAGDSNSATNVEVGAFKLGTERVVPNLTLLNLQRVVSVTATVSAIVNGVPVPSGQVQLTENPLDNRFRLAYHLTDSPRSPQMVIRRQWQGTSPFVHRLPDGTIAPIHDLVLVAVSVTWISSHSDSAAVWLANTPYHRYTEVDYGNEHIALPWEQGEVGNSSYARSTQVTQYDVRYRTVPHIAHYIASGEFYPSGVSPFYDPYTSELGHLVKVQFDLLISGLVRVSVRNRNNPKIVAAWLTEPTNEAPDPEAHWQYMTAGSNKTLYWDGVDNVGTWNFLQSEDYANAALGAFEQEQKPKIGKGFYVWNRERDGGNLGPLALIESPFTLMSGDLSRLDKAEESVGTYASWFILIEAKNDDLEQVAREGGRAVPRVTDSRTLLSQFQSNLVGSTTEAIVHTHLPAPTRLELLVQDWYGSTFDENDPGDNGPHGLYWTTTPDLEATINNLKPVRIKFNPVDRMGVLWTGRQEQQSVRVMRMAHLKAVIFDQFVVFQGVSYPESSVEAKQIVSRRLHNDTHTVRFEDAVYHRVEKFLDPPAGDALAWVFLPKHFRRAFTGQEDLEELRFGDYLQLEEVPKFDPTLNIGGTRSRLQLSFMAYLFYLSVYTQDRSGRFAWAIDPAFVDSSKILSNTRTTGWPVDFLRQHRRTVITRQWMREKPDGLNLWTDQQMQKWNLSGTIGEELLQHNWADHDPTSTTINGITWSSFSLATDDYTNYHRTNNNLNNLGLTAGQMDRQLYSLGLWTFEDDPTWHPCVFRDFWPYQLVPPMTDIIYAAREPTPLEARQANIYSCVDDSPYNYQNNEGSDVAKADVWNSGVYDQTEGVASKKKFDPGTKIEPKAPPVKDNGNVVAPHMADYIRQDDTMHWEELRGIFSRGPRPAEQVKKITPSVPYYIQAARWAKIWSTGAYTARSGFSKSPYLRLVVEPSNNFWMGFRYQYNWESASFFPTDIFGVEDLRFVNLERARFESISSAQGSMRYDGGAWVGWKDDGGYGSLHWNRDAFGNSVSTSVFNSGRMPIAAGPLLPQTVPVYMHLVLVNERRTAPLVPNAYNQTTNVATQILVTPGSVSGGVGTAVTLSVALEGIVNSPVTLQRTRVEIDDPTVAVVTPLWPASNNVIVTLRSPGSAMITFQIADVSTAVTVTCT
jgi:hypothetical protein